MMNLTYFHGIDKLVHQTADTFGIGNGNMMNLTYFHGIDKLVHQTADTFGIYTAKKIVEH